MKYPSFLKKGDTIGVLATSCGSNVNPYRIKTMQALKNLEKLGYKIKKGHRIYRNTNAVSAPHNIRAKDFMSFYKNKNINVLWSTGGGELMMGMLPYIDFEKISKLPAKLFIGFSDNTTLTFTRNEKNMTNYATPFGNLVIGIDTQRIALEMSEQKMDIKVDYALDINYEFLADCKISIEVSALPS